jgi:hypothetical protein
MNLGWKPVFPMVERRKGFFKSKTGRKVITSENFLPTVKKPPKIAPKE